MNGRTVQLGDAGQTPMEALIFSNLDPAVADLLAFEQQVKAANVTQAEENKHGVLGLIQSARSGYISLRKAREQAVARALRAGAITADQADAAKAPDDGLGFLPVVVWAIIVGFLAVAWVASSWLKTRADHAKAKDEFQAILDDRKAARALGLPAGPWPRATGGGFNWAGPITLAVIAAGIVGLLVFFRGKR